MNSNLSIVTFLNKVNHLILNPLIYLMFALSVVYFAYGVIRFLSADVADKSREEARNSIMWGLVGMIVMISVYGLIRFILITFGVPLTGPGADYLPL